MDRRRAEGDSEPPHERVVGGHSSLGSAEGPQARQDDVDVQGQAQRHPQSAPVRPRMHPGSGHRLQPDVLLDDARLHSAIGLRRRRAVGLAHAPMGFRRGLSARAARRGRNGLLLAPAWISWRNGSTREKRFTARSRLDILAKRRPTANQRSTGSRSQSTGWRKPDDDGNARSSRG